MAIGGAAHVAGIVCAERLLIRRLKQRDLSMAAIVLLNTISTH
jgi:hypothetical protein